MHSQISAKLWWWFSSLSDPSWIRWMRWKPGMAGSWSSRLFAHCDVCRALFVVNWTAIRIDPIIVVSLHRVEIDCLHYCIYLVLSAFFGPPPPSLKPSFLIEGSEVIPCQDENLQQQQPCWKWHQSRSILASKSISSCWQFFPVMPFHTTRI